MTYSFKPRHKFSATPTTVNDIRLCIERRLPSIRELHPYRKAIANSKYIIEESAIWVNLIASQVSWADIKSYCKEILAGGSKVKIQAESHKPRRRCDQDNINAGFNKLVIDSLKRKGCIADDSVGIVDVPDVVQVVTKGQPFCMIYISASGKECTPEAKQWGSNVQ